MTFIVSILIRSNFKVEPKCEGTHTLCLGYFLGTFCGVECILLNVFLATSDNEVELK